MAYKDIIYTKEEGIATITLNRPYALNAYTGNTLGEWIGAIEDAKGDEGVKVLVVTGAGRAFCSGMDLRQSRARRQDPEGTPITLSPSEEDLPGHLEDFHKPYLAAINGPAVGGGMDMASLCDIRIASDQARFGMVFVRLGVTPTVGGLYTLPRIVGVARALELIWTGRLFDAQEALALGYVSQVVPHHQLLPATYELAGRLARGPAQAIQTAKRLLYKGLGMERPEALQEGWQALTRLMHGQDAQEGFGAWAEKREPRFRGE